MKARTLWRVSVVLAKPHPVEESIGELLGAWFNQPASTYTDVETGRTAISVFLEKKPDWSNAARRRLKGALVQIEAPGSATRFKAQLTRMRQQDWASSWKRHFKPLSLGNKLLIQPSWTRRRPSRGQQNVILDPGMSFGTGQHPTTGFCLAELVRFRRADATQSCADIGTGSAILAICAAKLGYQPVHAIELDADALAIARRNAKKNRVSKLIEFEGQDLTKWRPAKPKRFNIVCANLLADLLLAQRDRLISLAEPGGILVLAGILDIEFDSIRRAYQSAGMRLIRTRAQKEWRSGAFLKTF